MLHQWSHHQPRSKLFWTGRRGGPSHPVGGGNARHRFLNYEGYVEGVCFPMFRSEVLEKVSLYDENSIRNQDDEFNYHLTRAGERVFISSRAQCTYFVGEAPSQLFRQCFQYGFWRVAVLRKHRLPASLRYIVPPLLISSTLVLALLRLSVPGCGDSQPGRCLCFTL